MSRPIARTMVFHCESLQIYTMKKEIQLIKDQADDETSREQKDDPGMARFCRLQACVQAQCSDPASLVPVWEDGVSDPMSVSFDTVETRQSDFAVGVQKGHSLVPHY